MFVSSLNYKGESLARGLAKRKVNVVLVARSKQKLEAVARDIEKTYNVKTKLVALDVFDDATNLEKQIRNELADIKVSIIINNIGGIPDTTNYSAKENLYKYFHEYEEKDYKLYRQFNMDLTYMLCRLYLPGMIESKQGAIINIGSLASITSAYLSLYATEKAKLNMFSKVLFYEYNKFNIDVSCALGGRIATPSLRNNSSPDEINAFDCCSSEKFAEDTLNVFNAPFVDIVYVPNWIHCIESNVFALLPYFLLKDIFEGLKQRHIKMLNKTQ